MKKQDSKTIYLEDYQPPKFLIDSTELIFQLYDKETFIISKLFIRRNPDSKDDENTIQLDGKDLELLSISVNDTLLESNSYSLEIDSIKIFDLPEEFTIESKVKVFPHKNTALEGLYKSNSLFCTQCEAEGFRKITWFLDRPDIMSKFSVRIEGDLKKFPVLLSNGNFKSKGLLPNDRHFFEWIDPIPKPCYLFALVAGNLSSVNDSFQTSSGKSVDLNIYVEPENINKCEYAMKSLKNAMRWDEEKYGREYDLEVFNIVAVNDFNMGAMENKSLNIFNSKYVLASSDTATDSDYQGIESVIGHEYFHNWTGNRVTCRDWFQLSLKEGFTVFRDQEFSADMGSKDLRRIGDVRLLKAFQFSEDAGPMAHPVRPNSYIEINNFYTVTVYEKGAEIVRMLALLLGPSVFRKATDLYFKLFDGKAVTTDDFIFCMEDASGRNFSQFKHWYDFAGTPSLDIEDEFDVKKMQYCLKIKQSVPDTPDQKNKPPFHIPLAVGLIDKNGNDLIENKTIMLEIKKRKEVFTFDHIGEKPTPSLARNFSAPVNINFYYSNDQLAHLISFDSDGFNRWNACQELFKRTILELIDIFQSNKSPNKIGLVDFTISALQRILNDNSLDKSVASEMFMIPTIEMISDFLEEIDIENINKAREYLKSTIAINLKTEILACYKKNKAEIGDGSSVNLIGNRALMNMMLSYLMCLSDDPEIKTLILDHYYLSDNMTTTMAGLRCIADSNFFERKKILTDFSKKWENDPLVIDKWFTVQAVSTRKNTLSEVKNLMTSSLFSIENPNRVRSLIGAFISGNPLGFHSPDGSGYKFLRDQVLSLDKINPQIAARLLRNMAKWKKFDPQRRKLMRTTLEKILSESPSINVYEIALKSLKS
tara:strand:+ start:7476 stop:10106 length:2631 start_codon:yes stop_codon:yes gene_type:complete